MGILAGVTLRGPVECPCDCGPAWASWNSDPARKLMHYKNDRKAVLGDPVFGRENDAAGGMPFGGYLVFANDKAETCNGTVITGNGTRHCVTIRELVHAEDAMSVAVPERGERPTSTGEIPDGGTKPGGWRAGTGGFILPDLAFGMFAAVLLLAALILMPFVSGCTTSKTTDAKGVVTETRAIDHKAVAGGLGLLHDVLVSRRGPAATPTPLPRSSRR